jgi:hypothetical protein
VAVTYWNGHDLVPVRNLSVIWATGSSQPTPITFDPEATARIVLTMTGQAPGTAGGFLAIAELQTVTA